MNLVKLADHLASDCVAVQLPSTDKRGTLQTMVDLVSERGLIQDPENFMQALLHREEIVSTGVGNGVAMPHADVPDLSVPRLALGVFPEGVDFEALDEEPVYVVFLLMGTPKTPGLHMKILARIARLSKDPDFFRNLRSATKNADILSALNAAESGH